MTRKTLSIVDADICDKLNHVLAVAERGSDFLAGICTSLETILMDKKAYYGFRSLRQHEVPVGFKPGINGKEGELLPIEDRFTDTEQYRRHYYITRK